MQKTVKITGARSSAAWLFLPTSNHDSKVPVGQPGPYTIRWFVSSVNCNTLRCKLPSPGFSSIPLKRNHLQPCQRVDVDFKSAITTVQTSALRSLGDWCVESWRGWGGGAWIKQTIIKIELPSDVVITRSEKSASAPCQRLNCRGVSL